MSDMQASRTTGVTTRTKVLNDRTNVWGERIIRNYNQTPREAGAHWGPWFLSLKGGCAIYSALAGSSQSSTDCAGRRSRRRITLTETAGSVGFIGEANNDE